MGNISQRMECFAGRDIFLKSEISNIEDKLMPGRMYNLASIDSNCLLAALVDLGEECLKNFLLEALSLVHGGDLGPQVANSLLLIVLVHLLQLELIEDSLYFGFELTVLATVGGVERLALLGCGSLQCLIDQPRALVILNISTDLSNDCWVTEGIQVVVLDLEILAKRDEDIVSLAEVLLRRKLEVVQSQGHGKVEAVISSLVGHDEHVLLHGEVVQVDIVLWGGDQVAQLTQLGLPGGLMEELHKVDVRGVRTEMFLENDVDTGFQHESVVDCDHAHALLAVPTGLATSSDGAVHDVVTNEEEGLQKLREPAQHAEVLELLVCQGLLEKSQAGIRNGETTVQLAARSVDIERLRN